MLASGETSVNDLAKPFKMSQPAISKHLKVLERAGLISTSLDKQRRPRRIEAAPLKEANEWLEKYRGFWESRYNKLDDLLEEMKAEQANKAETKSKRRRKNG